MIVGFNGSDDAAVVRVEGGQLIVQTVDFFKPIVDDPYQFGQIAAANSLSDIYAMGATPRFALNIVGFPIKELPKEVLTEILRGGTEKAKEAGIPIVGGHSIDDKEPKYGLVVTGEVNENKLIKIQERKNLLIVQIVQYKNSSVLIKEIDIDGLNLTNEAQKVISNDDTRILWCGPKNWLLVSTKKDLFTNIKQTLKEMDFAVTNLSHSRAIIELDGENSIEVLKKGCPFNFSELKKNNCVNSAFHGITITVDMIDDDPNKIRLFALRSFGESLYHSITDASLEFGYKAI